LPQTKGLNGSFLLNNIGFEQKIDKKHTDLFVNCLSFGNPSRKVNSFVAHVKVISYRNQIDFLNKIEYMTFEELGFKPKLLDGLDAMGFEEATPIQEQAIPIVLDNHDLIACAQTGTGKTGAYLLPVLNKMVGRRKRYVDTLILAPTRELAIQIDKQVQGFSYFTNTTSCAIYGGASGSSFETEKKALTDGADIIVATPGRLIAHLNMGYADLKNLKHLILDEADRMLDMGFHDDIMKITKHLPAKRQTLMFSATMPSKIRTFAKTLLKDPKEVSIAISKMAKGVVQVGFSVYDNQKVGLISHLLKDGEMESVIVFSSRKVKVKEIAKTLKGLGLKVAEIHSDLKQDEREDVINKFRAKQVNILVATDIVSRGIDIKGINMVINFDVPRDAEDYVHRVGRTARADSEGEAVTFINEQDQASFLKIEELIEQEVRKVDLEMLGFDKGPAYEPHKKRPSKGYGKSGGGRKPSGRGNSKPRKK
jgi:ATP-dependent RNA helicase RhlE